MSDSDVDSTGWGDDLGFPKKVMVQAPENEKNVYYRADVLRVDRKEEKVELQYTVSQGYRHGSKPFTLPLDDPRIWRGTCDANQWEKLFVNPKKDKKQKPCRYPGGWRPKKDAHKQPYTGLLISTANKHATKDAARGTISSSKKPSKQQRHRHSASPAEDARAAQIMQGLGRLAQFLQARRNQEQQLHSRYHAANGHTAAADSLAYASDSSSSELDGDSDNDGSSDPEGAFANSGCRPGGGGVAMGPSAPAAAIAPESDDALGTGQEEVAACDMAGASAAGYASRKRRPAADGAAAVSLAAAMNDGKDSRKKLKPTLQQAAPLNAAAAQGMGCRQQAGPHASRQQPAASAAVGGLSSIVVDGFKLHIVRMKSQGNSSAAAAYIAQPQLTRYAEERGGLHPYVIKGACRYSKVAQSHRVLATRKQQQLLLEAGAVLTMKQCWLVSVVMAADICAKRGLTAAAAALRAVQADTQGAAEPVSAAVQHDAGSSSNCSSESSSDVSSDEQESTSDAEAASVGKQSKAEISPTRQQSAPSATVDTAARNKGSTQRAAGSQAGQQRPAPADGLGSIDVDGFTLHIVHVAKGKGSDSAVTAYLAQPQLSRYAVERGGLSIYTIKDDCRVSQLVTSHRITVTADQQQQLLAVGAVCGNRPCKLVSVVMAADVCEKRGLTAAADALTAVQEGTLVPTPVALQDSDLSSSSSSDSSADDQASDSETEDVSASDGDVDTAHRAAAAGADADAAAAAVAWSVHEVVVDGFRLHVLAPGTTNGHDSSSMYVAQNELTRFGVARCGLQRWTVSDVCKTVTAGRAIASSAQLELLHAAGAVPDRHQCKLLSIDLAADIFMRRQLPAVAAALRAVQNGTPVPAEPGPTAVQQSDKSSSDSDSDHSSGDSSDSSDVEQGSDSDAEGATASHDNAAASSDVVATAANAAGDWSIRNVVINGFGLHMLAANTSNSQRSSSCCYVTRYELVQFGVKCCGFHRCIVHDDCRKATAGIAVATEAQLELLIEAGALPVSQARYHPCVLVSLQAAANIFKQRGLTAVAAVFRALQDGSAASAAALGQATDADATAAAAAAAAGPASGPSSGENPAADLSGGCGDPESADDQAGHVSGPGSLAPSGVAAAAAVHAEADPPAHLTGAPSHCSRGDASREGPEGEPSHKLGGDVDPAAAAGEPDHSARGCRSAAAAAGSVAAAAASDPIPDNLPTDTVAPAMTPTAAAGGGSPVIGVSARAGLNCDGSSRKHRAAADGAAAAVLAAAVSDLECGFLQAGARVSARAAAERGTATAAVAAEAAVNASPLAAGNSVHVSNKYNAAAFAAAAATVAPMAVDVTPVHSSRKRRAAADGSAAAALAAALNAGMNKGDRKRAKQGPQQGTSLLAAAAAAAAGRWSTVRQPAHSFGHRRKQRQPLFQRAIKSSWGALPEAHTGAAAQKSLRTISVDGFKFHLVPAGAGSSVSSSGWSEWYVELQELVKYGYQETAIRFNIETAFIEAESGVIDASQAQQRLLLSAGVLENFGNCKLVSTELAAAVYERFKLSAAAGAFRAAGQLTGPAAGADTAAAAAAEPQPIDEALQHQAQEGQQQQQLEQNMQQQEQKLDEDMPQQQDQHLDQNVKQQQQQQALGVAGGNAAAAPLLDASGNPACAAAEVAAGSLNGVMAAMPPQQEATVPEHDEGNTFFKQQQQQQQQCAKAAMPAQPHAAGAKQPYGSEGAAATVATADELQRLDEDQELYDAVLAADTTLALQGQVQHTKRAYEQGQQQQQQQQQSTELQQPDAEGGASPGWHPPLGPVAHPLSSHTIELSAAAAGMPTAGRPPKAALAAATGAAAVAQSLQQECGLEAPKAAAHSPAASRDVHLPQQQMSAPLPAATAPSPGSTADISAERQQQQHHPSSVQPSAAAPARQPAAPGDLQREQQQTAAVQSHTAVSFLSLSDDQQLCVLTAADRSMWVVLEQLSGFAVSCTGLKPKDIANMLQIVSHSYTLTSDVTSVATAQEVQQLAAAGVVSGSATRRVKLVQLGVAAAVLEALDLSDASVALVTAQPDTLQPPATVICVA